jgi:hypothetical protein
VIPAPALTDQALAAQPIAAVADGRPVVAPAPTPVPALGTTLAGPSSVPAPTPTPHIECGFATPLATPTPVDTSSTAEIVVREIRATDGRLRVADGVPDPPVTWDVAKVSGSARDLRLPALTYTGLDVRGGDFRFGGLHLSGARSARGSDLEFSGTDLALSATTPYLELVGLPYRFSGGWGSFRARLSIGEKGWTADTLLRLRDPRFADAASALDDAAGMPVARAVELLRDPEGDVVLRLPLSSASLASGGRIAQAISSGVRSSIRSAVEYSYIPVEVTFVPGRPQLTESSAQQLVSVGQLLESRSSLMAEIQAGTTRGDQRWLAEQSLSEGLREGGGGFMGVLRSLGVRDERQRIREALIARANGGPGPLDAEDEAVLERLLAEAPPVGPERLAALADARLATVRDHLVNRHYIERGRVITDRSQLEGAVVPIVRIEFRVGRPADIEPSVASPQEPVGARAAESDAWLGR